MKERINSRTGLIKYGCILGRDVIGGMKLLCWSNHFNVSENLQTKDIRDIFGFVVCLFLFFWRWGLRAERNLSTGPVTHVDPLTMIRKGDQEGGER